MTASERLKYGLKRVSVKLGELLFKLNHVSRAEIYSDADTCGTAW